MSYIAGLLSCSVLLAVFMMGGGNPAQLFDWRSVLLVVGGTAALGCMSFPLRTLGQWFGDAARAMRRENGAKLEEELYALARLAREKGVLALESAAERVTNGLVREGLLLISAATSYETVRTILQKQADCEKARSQSAQEFFERMAYLSIGVGVAGTLLKTVFTLHRYTGPRTLAPDIAGALLPVVYGALLAYLVLLPLAARVRAGAARHETIRQAAIEGVLAMQAGDSMFVVQQRLKTILHPDAEKGGRAH